MIRKRRGAQLKDKQALISSASSLIENQSLDQSYEQLKNQLHGECDFKSAASIVHNVSIILWKFNRIDEAVDLLAKFLTVLGKRKTSSDIERTEGRVTDKDDGLPDNEIPNTSPVFPFHSYSSINIDIVKLPTPLPPPQFHRIEMALGNLFMCKGEIPQAIQFFDRLVFNMINFINLFL